MIPVYDYFGLMVAFSEQAELPIIVYGSRMNRVSAFKIEFREGLMEQPKELKMPEELDKEDKAIFRSIVEKNSSELIKNWLNHFLYKKPVELELIKTRIEI